MKSSNVYYGVVEERTSDPFKLGRCRVRIVGVHTEDQTILPTKDLPWAYPMMPVNSASMNGIGISPTGVVEGTWCILIFRDAACQQPIIIGTIGGIPEEEIPPTSTVVETTASGTTVLSSGDGAPVTDSSGAPVQAGAPVAAPVAPKELKPATVAAKKPGAMKTSPAGYDMIIFEEGISSLVKGSNKAIKKYPPPGTILYAYLDTKKIWTVGVGSTFMLDGSRVGPDTFVTVDDARKMLEFHVTTRVERSVNRYLKVPVTQDMFDTLVSIGYNTGASGLLNSEAFTSLNTGKYEAAAAQIPGLLSGGGLRPRREREAKHFLRGGIPNQENGVDEPKFDITAPVATVAPDATENPAVRSTPEERAAAGRASTRGTDTGKVTSVTRTSTNYGFKDPNKKYPLATWLGEPDTHRLARHESIDKTVVFAKEAARVRGVVGATSNWTQPPIPYNAKYPYNRTHVTESGHVEEWDDTPGNERIHRYHKAGTYEEIDVNGSRVTRIVGDDYEILERHGHLLIKGNCHVTIRGDSNIRVDNNANIEVGGNMHSSVHGNWDVGVGGSIKMRAGGEIALDGSAIHLNSGRASVSPRGAGAAGSPAFGVLETPSRHQEIVTNYDSPEDGDNTKFLDAQIAAGNIAAEDVAPKTEVAEEAPAPLAKVPSKPVPADCEDMVLPFTSGTRLSPNYTMGDFIRESTVSRGIPSSPQAGFSVAELGCNMRFIALNVAEVVKAKYPNMKINSCYRSAAGNASTPGASTTSRHMAGLALDMGFIGFSARQKYEAAIEIQKILPDYDQIILEYSGNSMWVHVGLNRSGNRRKILTMDVGRGGKTIRDKFVLLR
jgi:GH24 family phage-related lysozyme (muramidase)